MDGTIFFCGVQILFLFHQLHSLQNHCKDVKGKKTFFFHQNTCEYKFQNLNSKKMRVISKKRDDDDEGLGERHYTNTNTRLGRLRQ